MSKYRNIKVTELSIIVGLASMIFCSRDLNGGKRHPNIDERIQNAIDIIKTDEENPIWPFLVLFLKLWDKQFNHNFIHKTEYDNFKDLYYELIEQAKELYPNSLHNGKGDAFRHTYFNAKNVISLGIYYAEALATAHENIIFNPLNTYQYKEKEMDLFNNHIGRNIGTIVQSDPNFFNMLQMVINYINNGDLRYLNPLGYMASNGIYYPTWSNSSTVLTPTNQ